MTDVKMSFASDAVERFILNLTPEQQVKRFKLMPESPLTMNIAATMIQRVYRGYAIRKKFRKGTLNNPEKIKVDPEDIEPEPVKETETVERAPTNPNLLMEKFVNFRSNTSESFIDTPRDQFRSFCATVIQSTWRGYRVRKGLRYLNVVFRSCVALIESFWLKHGTKTPCNLDPETRAAITIQRAWRAYSNRRIFQYYKVLLSGHSDVSPRELLMYINPREAELLDGSTKAFVRFRLVGWPPTVWYKIFTAGAICDVGAFAPRDYTDPEANWYQRMTNNNWRPVDESFMYVAGREHGLETPWDKVREREKMAQTKKMRTFYHHNKTQRQKTEKKKRKEKRQQWMEMLYTNVLKDEAKVKRDEPVSASTSVASSVEEVVDLDAIDLDENMEDLLDWTENLDFEAYQQEWEMTAVSAIQ
ncbi:hypothetical protein PCE1_001561 [Barthelona sp. PCE]